MIDNNNIESLPILDSMPFNEQSVLYSCYKGLLLANEVKTKVRGLIKEEKYYNKALRLSEILISEINNTLDIWIKYFEKKTSLSQQAIKQDYKLLKEYEDAGGFKRITPAGNSYFDGTLIRYGKILLGLRDKNKLGFEDTYDAEEFELKKHRDLISFKRFAEKMISKRFNLKIRLKNLEKLGRS